MVWLSLKFNFKIVIISIQKSFLLLILIPFLSGNFHSYSNSISNSFPFLLSISVKKNPFHFHFYFHFHYWKYHCLRYNCLMAGAIRIMYASKCIQMDPQQLLKTSKFYSIWKKCDMQKTVGGGYHPLFSLKGKGLAQGPYVAARAGVEPTTLRLKVIVSTKAPPLPTKTADLRNGEGGG